jgi:hypothetical protein
MKTIRLERQVGGTSRAFRTSISPEMPERYKPPFTFSTHIVQAWMGYTDLASTMRYLRPARGEKLQAQVEALWA